MKVKSDFSLLLLVPLLSPVLLFQIWLSLGSNVRLNRCVPEGKPHVCLVNVGRHVRLEGRTIPFHSLTVSASLRRDGKVVVFVSESHCDHHQEHTAAFSGDDKLLLSFILAISYILKGITSCPLPICLGLWLGYLWESKMANGDPHERQVKFRRKSRSQL